MYNLFLNVLLNFSSPNVTLTYLNIFKRILVLYIIIIFDILCVIFTLYYIIDNDM